MKKILIVALIGSLLTGCSVFAGTPTPQVVRETVMVTVEVPGPVETVIVTQEVQITPEPPAGTEAPTETEAPVVTEAPPVCTGYRLLSTVPFDVELNMDVGDPHPDIHAVIQAWDGVDVSTSFQATVEGTYNLDFEAEKVVGTFWLFEGAIEDVQCRAEEMWYEKGSTDYRLYVGAATLPTTDWSTEFPAGWTMNVTRFTQIPIEPGGDWESMNFNRNLNPAVHGSSNGVTNFQAWNGVDSTEVWHTTIEEGWQVTTTALQGSEWTVTGTYDADLLRSRFDQMSEEVYNRDNQPEIHKIYCGEKEPPSGWTTTMPAGWACEKIDP